MSSLLDCPAAETVSGLSRTMPKGTVAPGKLLPHRYLTPPIPMKGFTSLPSVPGWTVGFGFGGSSATAAAARSGWIVRIPVITNQMRF